MAQRLTKKQEAFCLKYVELGDASAAYRFAYSTEKMGNNTIHVKASELLKNGKVTVRIKELKSITQEVAEKEFRITKEQRLKWLEEIVTAGLSTYMDGNGQERRENLTAARGAIQELNTMLPDSEDKKPTPIYVEIGVKDAS